MLHRLVLTQAVRMLLILWRIDHNHTDAFTDSFCQRLVVEETRLQAFLIDINLFVEVWIEVILQSIFELFDESFREFTLTMTITNETCVSK